MALFDTIINDVGARFGLGANAAPLVREVLHWVVTPPGGLAGLFDKFKTAGLASEVASWLGRTDGAALTTAQVESVVGSSVLGGIANRLGLGGSLVSSAVGYILPKVIGTLTPGGLIPTSLPAEVTKFLSPSAAPRAAAQVAPQRIDVIRDKPKSNPWLLPALAAAALVGLGAWFLSNQVHAPAPVSEQPPVAPPAPAAPLVPPRLTLNDDGGVIHYSGAVHDADTRASIVDSLKAVFGADKIQGDITVDPNRGSAPWLKNLRAALQELKIPGVNAVFDGNTFNLGGVAGADRDRIVNAVKGLFGGLSIGAIIDKAQGIGSKAGDRLAGIEGKVGDIVSNANSNVAAALALLKSGSSVGDIVSALNQSIINFDTAGWEVPSAAAVLLQTAAPQLKQIAPGTVIEIAGYTDNTGDATANLTLSQKRADAVRGVLISAGVDPSVLVAKGYGSANPVASNDTEEGRFHNRRIAYRVTRS